MIRLFIKEYKSWYILYFLLLFLNFLVFYLVHLPLDYFITAGWVSLGFLLLYTVPSYLKFKRKIEILQDFIYVNELNDLQSPSELAYLNVIQKILSQSDFSQQELIKQKENLNQMIKMWVHQMKIPLSVLSLMEQTKAYDKVEGKIQLFKMENYLKQLLTYLKFSDYNDDYIFEQVQVADLIKQIIKSYAYVCISKDISISVSGRCKLKTDRKWLSFALEQIIDNAIKYSKHGGKIRIELKSDSIEISDLGIGILEADINRIFDDGFTGFNGHEHQKASGLGLYMTKKVLNNLELEISITSEIEKGTKVTITKSKR
ncbi:sensor histidine kinase [Streptococcus sp. FSL R7-0212]|uniref:sensor histidine kinase n=1 Tax=Streptococcus sp. FSL R7-0212 TaxID=2921726 RepID=UPI0030F9E3AD